MNKETIYYAELEVALQPDTTLCNSMGRGNQVFALCDETQRPVNKSTPRKSGGR